MTYTIALAGNPNSGKTTLFNALTGSRQRVGNWPGVTVEHKEGKLKGYPDVTIVDLPGIYSLSPYTNEEIVTRDYLATGKPDLIINVIDATNLERNLYFSTQLMEFGIPMVMAMNMMDIVQANGDKINLEAIAKQLNVQCVPISASKEEGIQDLIATAYDELSHPDTPSLIPYSNLTRQTLDAIQALLPPSSPNLGYTALKLLERDPQVPIWEVLSEEDKTEIERLTQKLETFKGDESIAIIADERYQAIERLMIQTVAKAPYKKTWTEKIDDVVTNRFLGLPLFALIMFSVYYLAISGIGGAGTEWIEGTLFGEIIPEVATSLLSAMNMSPTFIALIVDGALAGVGTVLAFVPQLAVLFLLLALLEECGYMSRIAFVMDRLFRYFGLSGKSFIPMLIGSGCSVPGIMAARTIESEADRKITIITTSFVPCSAKLPVITLIANAFFDGSALVAVSMYFLGIGSVLISGLILKKLPQFEGKLAPFVMELPPYHVPDAASVLRAVWDKVWAFIERAGTVIFISSVIIWGLQNFDFDFKPVPADASILAALGGAIAPIFQPLGFGNWQAAVATITGLVGKENIVSTLGILIGSGADEIATSQTMSAFAQLMGPLSAYSFLVFNMLCAPCFAAIGAMKTEMGTIKGMLQSAGYMTVFAYVITLIFYQLASVWLEGAPFTAWTLVALVLLALMVFLVWRPDHKKGRS